MQVFLHPVHEILIPKSTKSVNCLKQKVVTSGFYSDICIAYDKMILWMKILHLQVLLLRHAM